MVTETTIQTRAQIQVEIIILVQDVIMDIAEEIVQVLEQQQLQVGTQIHLRNKEHHRGEIIVIRVRLQRFLLHLPTAHRHHHTAVRQVAVHHLVAEVVEVEVQDKLNKVLTSKIPSNNTFEGVFSFKV